MNELKRPIIAGFDTANFTVNLQLDDLSNADAVRRARGDSGSSISWIIGHLLDSRCTALQACGVEQPNPYAKRFSFRSPATDGSDYPDIAELHRDWNALHEKLRETLVNLDDERLLSESSVANPHEDPSLAVALAFYAWHEAYHIGVMGLLRVQWGQRHTHELAMEALEMDDG
jgi:hypothetical protein